MATKTTKDTTDEKSAVASLRKKWGVKVWARGWTGIPQLLLRSQGELGINPSQLTILLQVLSFWWDANSKAYPSYAKIGRQAGLSERQVARHLKALEKMGYVRIQARRREATQAQMSNVYTFDGLVDRLQEIEKRISKEEREAKGKKGDP